MTPRPLPERWLDLLGSSTSPVRLVTVALAAVGLILFVAFITARLLRARTRGVSIRMQVFLALAATIGAFAFGLGLMVVDRIEARAQRLATQAASDEAAVVAAMLEDEIARTRVPLAALARELAGRRATRGDLSIELVDKHSRPLYPPGADGGAPVPGMVAVTVPLEVEGEVVGAVRVVKPTVVMLNLLADFAPTVLVISLVLGAAAALAAALIGRAIAAPIEATSDFAERVSEGQLAAAPQGGGGREVARLARAIDSMRRQLEGRPFVETFAADLSHELKNPVAAIRASAELLDEGALDDPAAARRFVARIRESGDRIERLLGELLGLARIEARGVEEARAVDVGVALRGAVDAAGEAAARVAVRTEGDLRVAGDPVWLSRALGNLLDNALVHSAAGARVAAVARREGDEVHVTVENPGEVPAHLRARVFRRFVTTRADRGGTGLGLAIVRAVAEAHGGGAELLSPGPPDVRFRLRLPAYRGAGAAPAGA